MSLLPKPYPDELVGSTIARACFHSGIPLKRMLQCVFGGNRSTVPFLMSWDLARLGTLTGLDGEELLERHTMFPYSVAFMPSDEQTRLRTKALVPRVDNSCLAALTKNVSHGVPFRRVCPNCIQDDIAKCGESYWHRIHFLPAVHICAVHGTRLRISGIFLRGSANTRDMALPHDVWTATYKARQTSTVLHETKNISIEALNGQVKATDDWLNRYRRWALNKGYELAGGAITGRKLAADLQRFFGRSFLTDTGCAFPSEARNPWPSLMVRERVGIPFAAPKHVLLQTFLRLARESNRQLDYLPPGRKVPNYAQEDIRTCQAVQIFLKNVADTNTRYTVKELLTNAGTWEMFRHNRPYFPKTNALIQGFRASDQSERQLGKRACWRRRQM